MELVKAFNLYRDKDLRHWYISDVPITTDEIQLVASVHFPKTSLNLGGTPCAQRRTGQTWSKTMVRALRAHVFRLQPPDRSMFFYYVCSYCFVG